MEVIESDLLREAGFVHGFTTRHGGVSKGAFQSLNLGFGVGDKDSNVLQNVDRLCACLGISEFWRVDQVHGRDVLVLAPGDDPDAIADTKADALIARNRQAVAVRVADCLPLLIADRETGVVAAVHCGWRSIASGIIEVVASQLSGHPRNWVGAIGPHIRPENFEIGADVAAKLQQAASPTAAVSTGEKWLGHLAAAVRAQLRAVGVADDQVEDVGRGTFEADFFSYRRDAGVTGRQVGLIVGQERR